MNKIMDFTKYLAICAAAMSVNLNHSVFASAAHKHNIAGVYSDSDALFSETIAIHTDGKYEQSETKRKNNGLHGLLTNYGDGFDFPEVANRSGTWRLLDKEGGVPIPYEAGQSLPPSAVVELKDAMPFGNTWENQPPFRAKGDRILPARVFLVNSPDAQPDIPTADAKYPVVPTVSDDSKYHITISHQK